MVELSTVCVFTKIITLWPNAWQPGTVSNRLNARRSNIFTQLPPKLLRIIRCLLRNVKRFRVFSLFTIVPGTLLWVDKSSDFVIRSAGKIVHQIILESLGKPKQTSNTVLLTGLFEVTDPCCHATVVTKTTYSTKPAWPPKLYSRFMRFKLDYWKTNAMLTLLDISKQTPDTLGKFEEPFSGILMKIYDCRAFSPFETVPGSLIRSVADRQASNIIVCTSSENLSTKKPNKCL